MIACKATSHWTVVGILLLLLCCLGVAAAQQPPARTAPFAITTESLPQARPHQEYRFQLNARGGVRPLHWTISSGQLPKGLELNEETGAIVGTPTEVGDFEITVTVSDSAKPPHTASKDFRLTAASPLSLQWKIYPSVNQDQISGSVAVSNGTKDTLDLTVFIVAVNEVGKAFALGYERMDLKPHTAEKEREITFGSTLPRGQYVIHADAVAEVPAKNLILRNRLQTPQPLVVTAPEI